MHLSSITYLKILTVCLILCPFFCLEIDLKWDLNMTPLSLDWELPSLLALLTSHAIDLLSLSTEFPLLSQPWNGQSMQTSSLFLLGIQQDYPVIMLSGRIERWINCMGGCGKQGATLSGWHFQWNHEPMQGREYLYVMVTGTCVTYRSLGNSIFIFINFNYRSAIKSLILCCVKNAEINCSWQLIGLCFSLPHLGLQETGRLLGMFLQSLRIIY